MENRIGTNFIFLVNFSKTEHACTATTIKIAYSIPAFEAMLNQKTRIRVAIAFATLISAGFNSLDANAGSLASVEGIALFLYSITHPLETIKDISASSERERAMARRQIAMKQCEAEIRELPDTFEIDEFIDEGASLRTTLLLKLLVDRRVSAIYVRPIKDKHFLRIARADSGEIWRAADGTSNYVKLEFGFRASGKCLPEELIPSDVTRTFDRPPYLLDSCITATYVDHPTAKHVLRYMAPANATGTQLGYWTILNLESNRTVAQLTSDDDPTTPSSGFYQDCACPYSSLADRIRPLTNKATRPITLRNITVSPNIFPGEIESTLGKVPNVIPIISGVTFNSIEEAALFNQANSKEGWEKAVTQAKKERIGHYGGSLLDLDQQELKSLKTFPDNRYGWDVTAFQNGFVVFPANWKRGEPNLLARYDARGKLEWAVKVLDSLDGCAFQPRSPAVRATANSIILYGLCKEGQGNSWTINKSSISTVKLP